MRTLLTRIVLVASLVAATYVATAPTSGAATSATSVDMTVPAATWLDKSTCPIEAGEVTLTRGGMDRADQPCTVTFGAPNASGVQLLAQDSNPTAAMTAPALPSNYTLADLPIGPVQLSSSLGFGACREFTAQATPVISSLCNEADNGWFGLRFTPVVLAESTSPGTSTARLRFGARVALTQQPSPDYAGLVTFTVVTT